MSELNASQTVAIAIEELVMSDLWAMRAEFPIVRFTFDKVYSKKGQDITAQTLNRELDRNDVRNGIVLGGEGMVRRNMSDETEVATILGHVAWTPSIAKSANAGQWILTAGISGVFATHPDGLAATSVARYAKQGFGHPRIYWHGPDGIRTATLPQAM